MAGTGGVTPTEAVRAAVAASLGNRPALVALGGGADSAVAAWATAARPAPTRGVFVLHHLPGSTGLLEAARGLATVLGMDLEVVDAPVADGSSLEARARAARRRALLGRRRRGELVVTGHTRDDQAETVLMNLFRGAGSRGLAGMSSWEPPWARPLLGFSRETVRSVADGIALPYTDDPANRERRHRRNRIRLDLIPELEATLAPGLRRVLARTAEVLRYDDEALEAEAAVVPLRHTHGAVLVPAPLLVTLPRGVAARAVRRALRAVAGPYPGRSEDVEAILATARGDRAAATIGGGIRIRREGPYVVVRSEPVRPPAPVPLPLPGVVRFGGFWITVRRGTAPWRWRRSVVAAPRLGPRPMVRAARLGDRIDLGVGRKRVVRALAEAGVPPRLRPAWPVVTVGAKIAAVPGVRVAAWASPQDDVVVIDLKETT